jgi:Flp pilus assembly protein TadG
MIKIRGRAFGRHWRRLARDTSGAILVEFAFVVGPLLALLIATLQVSLVEFAQQNLETTTEKATRQLLTGQAQGAGMTQSQFKTAVCSKLAAFMKCANVLVDVQKAADFNSADTSPPTITYDSNGNVTNGWTYAPGGAGQITVVRIMYVWDVSKGPLGFDLSTLSNGDRLLVATSVFKTEPYQ